MSALAAVWRSLGLEPSAVVGHSQGEIAAAVVAGILTLEEGARVVALRSQLLRGLSGRGAMAVTELAAAVVEERLKAPEWSGLSLAVVNTPGSTVVSGPTEAVERWVRPSWQGRGVLPAGQCGLRLAQRGDGPDPAGAGTLAVGACAAGGSGGDDLDGDGNALRGDVAGRRLLVPEPASDGAAGSGAGRADR